MDAMLTQLVEDVRYNCDVADASYAGNYTLCIYLLKMRELYRWSNGVEQSSVLDRDAVSNWVEAKEAYWDDLDSEFRPLIIDGKTFDAFDVEGINQALDSHQLVYGAGYGRGCRPQFFLASCESIERYPGYDIYLSTHEYARDLASPVAMSQGRSIYVRRESMRRMLWEQIEAWKWRKSPVNDPLYHALIDTDFEEQPAEALELLTDLQMEYVINHEIGEVVATEYLGQAWKDMLFSRAGSRLEIIARAVKDHLADAMVTLPALLMNANRTAMHLYFSNLTALRKQLFPELLDAYQQGDASLKALLPFAIEHWQTKALGILDAYEQSPEDFDIRDDDLASYCPAIPKHLSGL